MDSHAIDDALARYGREHHRYLELADLVASRCRRLAERAGIPATVQWRVKSPERVRTKLERLAAKGIAGAGVEGLDVLGDLAGVRIATWVEADRPRTMEMIRGAFAQVEVEVKDRPGSFYRATHCQITLAPGDDAGATEELTGLSCEVQVCSLLAHVCNEVEHGLVYAGSREPSVEERAMLDALGRLADAGDAFLTVLLAMRATLGPRVPERSS
jgi:ppGpp synthetase/RelA/SpoT-type nucleotidyltranferase